MLHRHCVGACIPSCSLTVVQRLSTALKCRSVRTVGGIGLPCKVGRLQMFLPPQEAPGAHLQHKPGILRR